MQKCTVERDIGCTAGYGRDSVEIHLITFYWVVDAILLCVGLWRDSVVTEFLIKVITVISDLKLLNFETW